MRVVASLTTMPDKLEKLQHTLDSLLKQTYVLDAIYLSVPAVSRRLGIPYPEMPKNIKSKCTIVKCVDYGPITKILGALFSEANPDTVIITFDDDMIYPPDLVQKLIEHHIENPDIAVGSSGMLLKYDCPFCAITPNENTSLFRVPKFSIGDSGRYVDSIYGYAGALYVRKFFPDKSNLDSFLKYSLLDNNTYMNDDIVISGYLSLNNIKRKIFKNLPNVSYVLFNGERTRKNSEISYNLDNFFQSMNQCIKKCKSVGMYAYTEPMDVSETLFGVSSLIVFCIAVLLVVLYFYYYFDSNTFKNIINIA